MADLRITGIATEAPSLADDDYVELDGLTNGSRKLRLLRRLLAGDTSRRIADVCISDGATSNRRIEWTPGTGGAVAAMPISIPFEFDVPTGNPPGSYVFGSAATGASFNANHAFYITFAADGSLSLNQNGASGWTTDIRSVRFAAFRTTYSGQRIRGMAVFASPNTTTAPVIYINGADVSASFSANNTGTPPNWISASLDTTKFVSGLTWPAGRFVPHAPILGALSAAEVLEWTQTGRLPVWCEVGTGSAVARYASDFSAGTDSWSANLVTAAGNIDGIGGRDDNLRVTLSGGSSSLHQISRSLTTRVGNAYQYTVDVYIPSTNANPFGVELRATGGSTTLASTTTKDSWVTLSGSFVETSDLQIRIRVAGTVNSDGDVFYVRNVKVYDLGPIFKPVIQTCRILDDLGANGIFGVLAAGIDPITDKRDWRARAIVDMSTTGNKQLFSSAMFADPDKQAFDSIEPTHGASGATYSMGDGTTATAYTASAAQTSGRKRLTLANPFPADSGKTGLYANVTVAGASETAVPIVVRGHRTD